MEERQALASFGALSQESRLQIVRMLVVAGPDGMSAGSIAERLEASPSNVSFHLKELDRAGLIGQQREARSIIYTANYDALSGLVRFLLEDCCAGHPDICKPMSCKSEANTNGKPIV
ncbi:metalloregulator ArsR/SmtB family transcription factor [Rhizobium sp. RM]|uniref:ArsR/SmtB family transcription factor n=1 Tax=Rhizobium sp. RM TaxID=2748079 RepID=UPI00110EA85B|nr:metalloregulator ArsR/SmtB family transcription factor [Rhizobium sp. RM]NWJ26083.1 helix-turn-helix transcriptional regulator [Rhizobium sp. RM]TMV20682.1 helix-turn-helix transcriptional regulator [Rhizobium sp. Td3]